ncbi:hypothetical protein [Pseudochrobactrum asaccharolyticum]|nr:hypothetical protein [Pseudochrobactrum asaccharolyticum]
MDMQNEVQTVKEFLRSEDRIEMTERLITFSTDDDELKPERAP